MDKWRELLASGESGEIEARLRRFDGTFRWFLIRAEPLHDETGKVVRWYGASTDIENLKRTEEKLRESEHELRRAEAELRQDETPEFESATASAGSQPRLGVPSVGQDSFRLQEKLGQLSTLRIRSQAEVSANTEGTAPRQNTNTVDSVDSKSKDSGPAVALDLNEVTLVDMDVVYFLGVCQKQGVKLLHCAPYICDWIAKEQERIK
jgi:PAS domain-containing protein